MPRVARRKSESGIYHVMLRGINKQPIFSNDSDKTKFLQILQKYKDQCGLTLYGYCLMNNHVHLLIQEGENFLLDAIMKRIAVSYAGWYNLSYQRIGHLFQDRFRSEPVDDERYFLTVLRYIHQNPLKAGICHKLDGYAWSSYRDYKNKSNALVEINFALDMVLHAELMEFFAEENDDICLEDNEQEYKMTAEQQASLYREISGGVSPEQFAMLPQSKQNEIIVKGKSMGIAEYKMAEFTGKSRYYIQKI